MSNNGRQICYKKSYKKDHDGQPVAIGRCLLYRSIHKRVHPKGSCQREALEKYDEIECLIGPNILHMARVCPNMVRDIIDADEDTSETNVVHIQTPPPDKAIFDPFKDIDIDDEVVEDETVLDLTETSKEELDELILSALEELGRATFPNVFWHVTGYQRIHRKT